MNNCNHLMVDIETFGNLDQGELPVISQISARWFNPLTGETDEKFFSEFVDLDSCKELGGTFTSSTVVWWLEQNSKSLVEGLKNKPRKISTVLELLNKFIRNQNVICSDWKIYGKSPKFDLRILEDYYRKIGMNILWSRRNELDLRTIEYASKLSGSNINSKPTHNALEDVDLQIRIATDFYKKII